MLFEVLSSLRNPYKLDFQAFPDRPIPILVLWERKEYRIYPLIWILHARAWAETVFNIELYIILNSFQPFAIPYCYFCKSINVFFSTQ